LTQGGEELAGVGDDTVFVDEAGASDEQVGECSCRLEAVEGHSRPWWIQQSISLSLSVYDCECTGGSSCLLTFGATKKAETDTIYKQQIKMSRQISELILY